MGYIKLICFCIWMIQKIGQIGPKRVTEKTSGKVLCGLSIVTMVIQMAGGILLTVYSALIQILSKRENADLPNIWWTGIVPFFMGIGGIVLVYQRRRQRIVIWILINITLYFGELVLLTMTDGLSVEKYGLSQFARDECKTKTKTTTTMTTMTTTTPKRGVHEFFHVMHEGDRDYGYDRGDVSHDSSVNCKVFDKMEYSLMPGLVVSLLFYTGACLLSTVFASIIGCCLQECVEDVDNDGPDFEPIPQTMDHNGVMSVSQPQFVPSSLGYPAGQLSAFPNSPPMMGYPGHHPNQLPTRAPGQHPGHQMTRIDQQYGHLDPAYRQQSPQNYGQPDPRTYGQPNPYPNNYGQEDPRRYGQPDVRYAQPGVQHREAPSAPTQSSVRGEEFMVESDTKQLV